MRGIWDSSVVSERDAVALESMRAGEVTVSGAAGGEHRGTGQGPF